jgi:Arc/MetJ family transcription regulator
MRTNIVIDDDLVEQAFSLSRTRTKKALIDEALRELIRLRRRKDLTDLAGSVEFYKGYDYKKLRKMRG